MSDVYHYRFQEVLGACLGFLFFLFLSFFFSLIPVSYPLSLFLVNRLFTKSLHFCSSDSHVKTVCSFPRSWLSQNTTSTCSRLSVGKLVFSILSSRSHRTVFLLVVLHVLITDIFRVSSAVKHTDGPNTNISTCYLTALSSYNHIKICTHNFTDSNSHSLIFISPVTASPVSQAISLIIIKKKKDMRVQLKRVMVGVTGGVVVRFISSFVTCAIYSYRKGNVQIVGTRKIHREHQSHLSWGCHQV